MATALPHFVINLRAASDLRDRQFYGVRIIATADRSVDLAALGAVDGVLLNKPNAGQIAVVGVVGIFQAIAGGAITRGSYISTDASGKFIAITPNGSGTTLRDCVGKALESAVNNDIISMLFHPVRPVET